jgi:GNAT superfamily N-acetyltransferase
VNSARATGTRLVAVGDDQDLDQASRLLHDFNIEFHTPTPGVDVLTRRLRTLLSGDLAYAVIAGRPAVGIALVTLRQNIWEDGLVALLDELYVVPRMRSRGIGTELIAAVRSEAKQRGVDLIEINVDEPDLDARRFYERLGFTSEGDGGQRALYYCGPADR